MRETEIWSMLYSNWPRERVHLTRIENAATFGTPDVQCCADGYEWWMELKIDHSGYSVIRPTQLAWIAKHIIVNGNIYIFAVNPKNNLGMLYHGKDLIKPGSLITNVGSTKINFVNMEPVALINIKIRGNWHLLLNKIICLLQNKNVI